MKGWIVVSSSRLFLTHQVDEDRPLEPFIGWTAVRANALRFASERQAKQACTIYPLADATVEPAKPLSKSDIILLDELERYEGVVGPQVSLLQDRLYEGLQRRGFVFENVQGQWDITAIGKRALREVTS